MLLQGRVLAGGRALAALGTAPTEIYVAVNLTAIMASPPSRAGTWKVGGQLSARPYSTAPSEIYVAMFLLS